MDRLNKEIYGLNEQLLVKVHQAGDRSVDTTIRNIRNDQRLEEAFNALKDANIKQQAEMGRLKSKLMALHADMRLYQVSSKLKADNSADDSIIKEASIDSDKMIEDGFTDALEVVLRLEKDLRLEAKANCLTGLGLFDTKTVRNRRRSEGNLTVSWMANVARTFGEEDMQAGQRLNLPEFRKQDGSLVINETMHTEYEYLRILQDKPSNVVDGQI